MKQIPKDNKGLAKLPKSVRNKMGYMNKGGTPSFKTCPSCTTKAACRKAKKCKKRKNYVLGGPATPEQGEQSRYRPSAARSPQGMMSARGMTSGMAKMKKGGYVNPVTIVDNLKKKK